MDIIMEIDRLKGATVIIIIIFAIVNIIIIIIIDIQRREFDENEKRTKRYEVRSLPSLLSSSLLPPSPLPSSSSGS
jgi:hypothetical protein